MNKNLKQFLNWLKENDRSEEEKMQCKLLDEYMKTRDNLTGGDVTKEDTVLHLDCWRALTELDAKAREAEELEKMRSKN